MAGIDTLFKGAVGSLAKDKITNTLTPTQMELASFILNPQYYIAEKGVNKIAEILGYGSDYKNLSADEKSDKAYYKEIMRDTVGDMLPESLGDIVRATPRETEPYDPYNGYFAQNINDWVSTRDSTPEKLNAFENTVRDMNYGTQTPGTGKYVGPLAEDNAIFESNVSNLPYELKSTPTSGAPDDFDPALLAAIIRGDSSNTVDNSVTDDMGNITITDTQNTNTPGGDFVNTRSLSTPITESVAPTGYTFDSNIGAVVPATSTESLAPVGSVYDANIGANVPVTDTVAPTGYTFDANTGTVVPVINTDILTPSGYTFDTNAGLNVPTSVAESAIPVESGYDANIGQNVPTLENVAPMGYTFDANTGTVVPVAPAENLAQTEYTFDMDTGAVVPVQDMSFEPAYYGGGGGKLENYYYSEYRRGGQIRKGKR